MAVVINKNDDSYTLGTKHGVLDKQFSRNQFQVAPNKFINNIDVPDEQLNVRKEAMKSSGSKQGFIRCGCKKKCSGRSCKCVVTFTKRETGVALGYVCPPPPSSNITSISGDDIYGDVNPQSVMISR
ncbi:hypothetical protein J6590_049508 [Homalodisca vitripennis]|nr:hypothetical protein J6590_049508 [Homalodisca vitripennis]